MASVIPQFCHGVSHYRNYQCFNLCACYCCHNIEDDDGHVADAVTRPRSEPSFERMRVGMAPLTLTRPVDQVAPESHHRSHADIVLSPTPPPKAPVQPPWQPARARATVAMSPQPVPVVPAPSPVRTAVSPIVPTVDTGVRAAPKPLDLLDDER